MILHITELALPNDPLLLPVRRYPTGFSFISFLLTLYLSFYRPIVLPGIFASSLNNEGFETCNSRLITSGDVRILLAFSETILVPGVTTGGPAGVCSDNDGYMG